MQKLLQRLLGLGEQLLYTALALLVAVFVGALLFAIFRKLVLRFLGRWGRFSENQWDTWFQEEHVYYWSRQLLPTASLFLAAPVIFSTSTKVLYVFKLAVLLYAVIIFLFLFEGLLDVAFRGYQELPLSEEVSLLGVMQMLKVLLYLTAALLAISVLFNKSPALLLSGLGAITAVLLLVFKETLLGLVAGIKLATNRMLVEGDTVDIPKHGASGVVQQIGLNTVEIYNWDKTTTYLPTHLFMSDAFINWRSLPDFGGRRIKRSIPIDMETVRTCDEALLEELSNVRFLEDYITEKTEELSHWGEKQEAGVTHPANSPRLTNLGLFRGYLQAYLKAHPRIHKEQSIVIRQLEPSANGLPLELYAFTNTPDWVLYEETQSEIFEHILSMLPHFQLKPYQHDLP
jgi:miniconductance mechanosensitive channel